MSQRQTLHGFVLHKRAYRETSLLVDFFTLEQGRITAVAKGARGNSKSDRKSLLQPLQACEFELSGRTNLKTLLRLDGSASAIRLSHNALYCAFYINELLSRALPEAEPIAELFEHYQRTLNELERVKSQELSMLEPILREFEFTLLQCLGYLPDFAHDADAGEDINPNQHYLFNARSGFHLSHAQMRNAVKGNIILLIAKGEYEDEQAQSVRQAAKYICRASLRELVGDKPIKSRELFVSH